MLPGLLGEQSSLTDKTACGFIRRLLIPPQAAGPPECKIINFCGIDHRVYGSLGELIWLPHFRNGQRGQSRSQRCPMATLLAITESWFLGSLYTECCIFRSSRHLLASLLDLSRETGWEHPSQRKGPWGAGGGHSVGAQQGTHAHACSPTHPCGRCVHTLVVSPCSGEA